MNKPITKIKIVLSIIIRTLMGMMWTISGYFWFINKDPKSKLLNELNVAAENGMTFTFYQPFINEVVLPNVAIFVFLVSLGELLTGLCLLSGFLVKVSATVALFLLLNYSLMNGTLISPYNLLFLGIHVYILISNSGKKFGLDKILFK